MSDFGHYGGSDEDYAAVRKHNAEVVSIALGFVFHGLRTD